MMYRNFKYRVDCIRILSRYAEKKRLYVFLSFILSALFLLVELLTPQLYNVFINDIILDGASNKMIWVCWGYIILFFIGIILAYVKYFIKVKFSNKLILNVKSKILKNYFSKEYEEYDKLDIGDIKMRMEDDTQQAYKFVDMQSIDLIITYLTFLVCVIILFAINIKLAIFSLIFIPITIFIDNFFSNREDKLNRQNRVNDKNMYGWLYESVRGWKEIKALNLEQQQEQVFNQYLLRFSVYYKKWVNYWTMRVLVLPKIKDVLLMQWGLYLLGGIFVMNGELKIGSLLMFSMYYDKLCQAIKIISNCEADLQANRTFTDRLMNELSNKNEGANPKTKLVLSGFNEITVRNVSYRYSSDENYVLKNVNVSVNGGDILGIMGHSGSGKTTLLKLISGMIVPTSGEVLYNGHDLRSLDIDSIHDNMAFVTQDPVLLNGTLRDNFQYGKSNVDDDEIFDACQKAHIYDFIVSLPNGLDTVVGERGAKLSCGQRQRIVLAKAFLKNPYIYVLDEVTSNLDPLSEKFVRDALRNIEKDKIIIVVSHRKSTLMLCNKIFSIDENEFVSSLNEWGEII